MKNLTLCWSSMISNFVVLAQIVSEIYAWVSEIVFELLHKQQNADDVILRKDLKHIV